MHDDDFFAWVRLMLLLILILAFIIWVKATAPYNEQPEQIDRKEPVYLAQATPHTITPAEAETGPEPTSAIPPMELL